MKNVKKVPTKQLEKFSNIFTQLGLVLVLFIVYVTLEHKTEDKALAVLHKPDGEKVYIEPDQIFDFIKEVKVKIKPQVQKSQVFIPEEIIKGEDDIIETIIDDPIEDILELSIEDIVEIKEKETFKAVDEVPFMMIQNAPVFKGCEGLSKKENKVCFDKKMKKFIHRNFDTDLANEIGLDSGIHKIQTQFLIDEKGNVVDIKIRTPYKQLEKEADRLIKKLPKFTPGKQQNTPVRVRYTLPIAFSVE